MSQSTQIGRMAIRALQVAQEKARMGMDAELEVIKCCFAQVGNDIVPMEKTIIQHLTLKTHVAKCLFSLEQEYVKSANLIQSNRK